MELLRRSLVTTGSQLAKINPLNKPVLEKKKTLQEPTNEARIMNTYIPKSKISIKRSKLQKTIASIGNAINKDTAETSLDVMYGNQMDWHILPKEKNTFDKTIDKCTWASLLLVPPSGKQSTSPFSHYEEMHMVFSLNTKSLVSMEIAMLLTIQNDNENENCFFRMKLDQFSFKDYLLRVLFHEGILKICFNFKLFYRVLVWTSNLYGMRQLVLSQFPLPEVIDPRVGQWALNPDVTVEDLSFEALCGKYKFDGKECNISASLILLESIALDQLSMLELMKLDIVVMNQEMPLAQLLAEMEIHGIGYNSQEIENARNVVCLELLTIQNRINEVAGSKVNVSSPQQVAVLLFDILQFPVPINAGKPSRATNEASLRNLAQYHPEVIGLILRFRKLQKMVSTCRFTLTRTLLMLIVIDGLEANSKQYTQLTRTSNIHPSWNQMCTSTGRLSSSEPNLQNLPRDPYILQDLSVIDIRSTLVGDTRGSTLISADYSQVEIRMLAYLSSDPHLLAIFKNTECSDVYLKLAADIFETPITLVTDVERSKAKHLCLAIVYGMGNIAISNHLSALKGVSVTKTGATELVSKMMKMFPKLMAFKDQTRKSCKKNGYVETISRRKRYLPDINSRSEELAQGAQRQAVNTIIQGSSSDIMKQAMLMIRKNLWAKFQDSARIVLQVHDEIVVQVNSEDEKDVQAVITLMSECMRSIPGLQDCNVPFPVNFRLGFNFANLEPVQTNLQKTEVEPFDFESSTGMVSYPKPASTIAPIRQYPQLHNTAMPNVDLERFKFTLSAE